MPEKAVLSEPALRAQAAGTPELHEAAAGAELPETEVLL